jgi:tetratricopeptide (TPR) repeat protein
MAYRSSSRAAALIVFVVCAMTIGVIAAEAQRSDDLDTLNQQVVQLYQGGKYAEATDVAQRALALAKHQFGPNHTKVATALNNLATLYCAQGRYAEAEPLYKRVLAITEKGLGPDHPLVGTALNNLAELYGEQGRYDEAHTFAHQFKAR